MLTDLFFVVWFFLPAGMANMTPILVAKWPGIRTWNAPVDGGATYKGKRIFGEHKTWRGFVTGMLAATLVLWLQQLMAAHIPAIAEFTAQVDYASLPLWIVGPLFGFGALAGDAIESFFKRQKGVPPGHSWFPFDQIDYIIGGALVVLPFVQLYFWQYVALLAFWLIIHLVASYIGFKLHLKDKPI